MLTPEAKKSIQFALGTKDSLLRRTTNAARIFIGLAKRQPCNVIDYGEVNGDRILSHSPSPPSKPS